MRLVGLMPVRNEDWIIGLSARVALLWCDALVVLLHNCTDRSEERIGAIEGDITLLKVKNGDWDEMAHRQAMLEAARDCKATHIAIIDADEVLTSNLVPSVRDYVDAAAPNQILYLPGYNLRNGITKYHANGIWGDRWFATAFTDNPVLGWFGDRFHHREPFGIKMGFFQPVPQGRGGTLHFWGASACRLLAKHALYKMTETLRWPEKPRVSIDRYYNQAIYQPHRDPNWEYAAVPSNWMQYKDWLDYVEVDAKPWQVSECKRLLDFYGKVRFQGLDLFGVV